MGLRNKIHREICQQASRDISLPVGSVYRKLLCENARNNWKLQENGAQNGAQCEKTAYFKSVSDAEFFICPDSNDKDLRLNKDLKSKEPYVTKTKILGHH